MTKSMLPRRLSIARIQHEGGTQQLTVAIDKLMAAGCAGARARDGLSSFFRRHLGKNGASCSVREMYVPLSISRN